MPRLRLPVAILAATLVLLASGGRAYAQMPPYTAYGMGLHAGDVVTASIEGVECGRTKVSAAGNWKITIPAESPCQPQDGATIHFAVDGDERSATARWSGGGAPVNPRVGIALGPPATPSTTSTPAAKATPDPTPTATKAASTPTPVAKPATPAVPAPTKKATPKAAATPRPRPTVAPWPWLARPSR